MVLEHEILIYFFLEVFISVFTLRTKKLWPQAPLKDLSVASIIKRYVFFLLVPEIKEENVSNASSTITIWRPAMGIPSSRWNWFRNTSRCPKGKLSMNITWDCFAIESNNDDKWVSGSCSRIYWTHLFFYFDSLFLLC